VAKLVCPFGHQEVMVDGDGHDYEGVCDVCGRKLRIGYDSQADVPAKVEQPVSPIGGPSGA
jgi:hypothetical protein